MDGSGSCVIAITELMTGHTLDVGCYKNLEGKMVK